MNDVPPEILLEIIWLIPPRSIGPAMLSCRALNSVCAQYVQTRRYWHALARQDKLPILKKQFWHDRFHMSFGRFIAFQYRQLGLHFALTKQDHYNIKYQCAQFITKLIHGRLTKNNKINNILRIYVGHERPISPIWRQFNPSPTSRTVWINGHPYTMAPAQILRFLTHNYCINHIMFLYDFVNIAYNFCDFLNESSATNHGTEIEKIKDIITNHIHARERATLARSI